MSVTSAKTKINTISSFLSICFCIFILFKNFNVVSLWLDETVSYWVIKDGIEVSIGRSLEFQGQSPLYYVLLAKFSDWFGSIESVLRMPSLICIVLSMLTLFFISREYFSVFTSLFVMAVFISFDAVLATLSARPYALALLFCLLSCLALVRWLRTSNLKWLVIYILSFALTLYAHYIFVGVLCVHLAIFILTPKQANTTATKFFCAIIIAFLFLAPIYSQVIHVTAKTTAWSFSPEPSLIGLVKIFFPAPIIVSLLLALCLGFVLHGRNFDFHSTTKLRQAFFIFLTWYLIWPLVLFSYSFFFAGSLFIDRYCLLYVPGFALCLGALIESVSNVKMRSTIALSFMAFIFIREMDKTWTAEGWKEAASVIAHDSITPILVYPGLIEASSLEYFNTEQAIDYLRAPMQYYKLPNKISPIPLVTGDASNEKLLIETASKQKEFFFVYLNKKYKGNNVSELYSSVFKQHGYSVLPIANFGLVGVNKVSKIP